MKRVFGLITSAALAASSSVLLSATVQANHSGDSNLIQRAPLIQASLAGSPLSSSLVPVFSHQTSPLPEEHAKVAPVPQESSLELPSPDFRSVEPVVNPTWMPPDWFPVTERSALWALSEMDSRTGPVGPDLQLVSRSAFMFDVDSGEVLFSQAADTRFPVASLTKLLTGLALVAEQPDLDRTICLDQGQMPSWPGATSRLHPDTCTQGWDLLGAALVRSDNGAAYALSKISGLEYSRFIQQMNVVADDLGMEMSTFAGATGVEDDNISTARDMTRAVLAASLHPDLSPVLNAPYWDLADQTRQNKKKRLLTTNRLIDRPNLDFMAAKTGYTDTARHCFATVVRLEDGRKLALTVLGAKGSSNRWTDVKKLLRWASKPINKRR